MDPTYYHVPSSNDRIVARRQLRRVLRLPQDAIVGVSVGRLDLSKDPELLLQAFLLLKCRYEHLYCVWVGEGILREKIEHLIDMYRLDRFILLGQLDAKAIASVHHGSDFYVSSASYEGMSIALLEAQACGLPAVVPRVGEADRTVFEGKSGAIVKDRTPEGFVETISLLLNSLSQYRAENCARSVARYSASVVVQSIYGSTTSKSRCA